MVVADHPEDEAGHEMPLYEFELRSAGDTPELRVGDQPLTPGETLVVSGRLYRVLRAAVPHDPHAAARYVCVEVLGAPRLAGA